MIYTAITIYYNIYILLIAYILNTYIRRWPTSTYAGRAVVVVVLAHQPFPSVTNCYAIAWVAILSGAHGAATASVAGVWHAWFANRVPVGTLTRVGAVGSDLRVDEKKIEDKWKRN